MTYLFLAAAARSRCRRFLNQLPTCVGVSPVACASSRFLVGFGYGSCKYHSRNRLRVRSLKQCVFCSPSQMVRGNGNFLRTRYLSTGPVTDGYKSKTSHCCYMCLGARPCVDAARILAPFQRYLRVGRAAFPLRGSAPPATWPAACRASVW